MWTSDEINQEIMFPYVEGLAEIDATYRHIRIAFPRAHYRLEWLYLRIWAGLVAVQPHARAAIALILYFASVGALAPSAAVFSWQSQAHTAVVRHVAASVYYEVYIVWIVQRFWTAPDHGEGYRDIRRTRGIRKLCLFAVDRVGQQARVDTRHATLDVELTHETRLYNELLKIGSSLL